MIMRIRPLFQAPIWHVIKNQCFEVKVRATTYNFDKISVAGIAQYLTVCIKTLKCSFKLQIENLYCNILLIPKCSFIYSTITSCTNYVAATKSICCLLKFLEGIVFSMLPQLQDLDQQQFST